MQTLKKKHNILCVDDIPSNLFTLEALLSTVKGLKIIQALSGEEALDAVLKNRIDLILCDIKMPEMSGFQLAKILKSNKRTRDIPIIFVTAEFKTHEFVKEGFEIGAVDYVTKPIDDNQLLNKLHLYLKLFEKAENLKRSEKKFQDIAQSIGDGIYTLDKHGNTTFINREALNILGYKKSEVLHKNIHELIHYKDINNRAIPTDKCSAHKLLENGKKHSNSDEHLINKDGNFVNVSIVITPLYIDNEIIGTVTVFRDKSQSQRLSTLENEKILNQDQMIKSMIDMIEARDSYTAGHTKRVAKYCVLIAKEMDYSKQDIELLEKSAWLHDIGKISTPDSVLLKPGRLDREEYELIQDHLSSGYDMLNKMDQYRELASIMREHHEKYDGTGYPQGLKGNNIHPLSRIMMVADAFDAMTTNRVYKAKKTVDIALRELEDLSAKHFHPEVVSSAVKALGNVEISSGISQLPQTKVEKQRFSYFYKDRLTNMYIIEYLSLVIRYHIQSNNIYLYEIDLKNFGKYNSKFGWTKGDNFLIDFATELDSIAKDGVTFRVEGDDFLVLSEIKIEHIESKLQELKTIKKSIVNIKVEEIVVQNIKDSAEELLQKYIK